MGDWIRDTPYPSTVTFSALCSPHRKENLFFFLFWLKPMWTRSGREKTYPQKAPDQYLRSPSERCLKQVWKCHIKTRNFSENSLSSSTPQALLKGSFRGVISSLKTCPSNNLLEWRNQLPVHGLSHCVLRTKPYQQLPCPEIGWFQAPPWSSYDCLLPLMATGNTTLISQTAKSQWLFSRWLLVSEFLIIAFCPRQAPPCSRALCMPTVGRSVGIRHEINWS